MFNTRGPYGSAIGTDKSKLKYTVTVFYVVHTYPWLLLLDW
jgi:hypothetical protein